MGGGGNELSNQGEGLSEMFLDYQFGTCMFYI